jgi:hypothetical protein
MSAQRRQRVEGDAATIMGIVLIVIGHWAGRGGAGAWLPMWPVSEIGLGLLTTGLFRNLAKAMGRRSDSYASPS